MPGPGLSESQEVHSKEMRSALWLADDSSRGPAPCGKLLVVHEVNGEAGVQPLSCSEVEELLHKADEAALTSRAVLTSRAALTSWAALTPPPTAGVQEEAPMEITGLEAKPGGMPSVMEATAQNPVTMVFMGYQNVEDEDETKKVLGLQGTVKAELVLIHDGKTPRGGVREETPAPPPPTSTKPPEMAAASNEEVKEGVVEVKGGVEEVKEGVVEVKGVAEEVKEGVPLPQPRLQPCL
ncbi:paralemmin 1a [Pseudoliparis swirei]|uniref:paralemmin 1a n=1 Tax=Pseudoliparis swirei TaxID=2059687 RepID=UPI0024BEF38B|nr:paralemmin 1a [Pseudoliparis swirei]